MWFLALLFAVSVLLGTATPAAAIPRYSARYGQNCLLCHQDPSGGAMRSAYASEYLLPHEIAMRPYDERSQALLEHALSKSVSIGADVRTLTTYSAQTKTEHNFFEMQGDVYLHFQLDRRFSIYFDRGITGSYELFGTAFILPVNGYVKVGRYTPPFGWRLDDHTSFVREGLGYFTPPSHTDVGFEIGFSPGSNSLAFAVMNGAPGAIRDSDDARTYFVRAERRMRFGPARVAVGGSFLEDDGNFISDRAGGPFAAASVGPLTWVGECDWRREKTGLTTGLVTSHEVSWQLLRGFDLLATYDFHDPDLDHRTGAHRRIGFGVDVLPFPFLGLLAKVNFHEFDAGTEFVTDDYVEARSLIHFFY